MLTLENAFTTAEIAAAINVIPNMYGRLGDLNLFPVRGVTTNQVAVEEQNGSLSLIPSEAIGGPGAVGKVGKRKVRSFPVPRLVYDEHVNPNEVQNVRAFGGNELLNMSTLLNQKLGTARGKHDITLEHLRMGALKGIILDADGTSELANLYTAFDITAKEVDFVLGTAGTDILDKCREVTGHIEDNLKGDRTTGVHALVSPEFFQKFIRHAKVKEHYLGWINSQSASILAGGSRRMNMFPFGDIMFEEYRATATGSAGSAVRFIAANSGHAFPLGTMQTFATFVAPADFNESVNQLGQLYYAKVQPAKHDRGYDVHTQSNPLPMCMRPAVLVRCFSSN